MPAQGEVPSNVNEPLADRLSSEISADQELEQPTVDQVMEEKPEEALNEEAPESDILNLRMKEGDKLNYKGHTIEMVDILVGLELELKVDGKKLLMHDTGTKELINNIRLTYVNAFDYNKDNAVNMRLEPFTLGPDEYLIDKGGIVTINGYRVKLSDVRFDDTNKIGYVSVDTPETTINVARIVEGKTGTVGNATVTAVETFYQYQPYAVLKIIV